MHCEIVLAGLPAGARSASLELLFARGRRSKAPAARLEDWLQQAFALEGRLAAGALSVLGAGEAPGDASWVRADPVHLHLAADRRVVLAPGAALGIAPDEARALCDALSRHFAGTLAFRALDAAHWCARLERPLEFGDAPPLAAAGSAAAPRPADALLTEAQMLLHAHEVNQGREARGEPALNSLWFWGEGRLPSGARSRWQSVTSADPLALGLARLAGAAARSLPASAPAWLAQAPDGGRHLIVLDTAEAVEQAWCAPLADALRRGRVGMLTVHLLESGVAAETVRGDLRRFWRRAKALAEYA